MRYEYGKPPADRRFVTCLWGVESGHDDAKRPRDRHRAPSDAFIQFV